MKHIKIIKLFFGLFLYTTCLVDAQYCSQCPPLAKKNISLLRPEPIRHVDASKSIPTFHTAEIIDSPDTSLREIKNFSVSQTARAGIRDTFLKQYKDEEIVDYWTSALVVSRIESLTSIYVESVNDMLNDVIALDYFLQKNKASQKSMFFIKACNKIRDNVRYSSDEKNASINYMIANKETIKDALWLEYMYECKDIKHKEIENKKSFLGISRSYHAWPYIREIAKIKGFPEPRNLTPHQNFQTYKKQDTQFES